MNRRTFMQKTGLIMPGLILSPLTSRSYSFIYGQAALSDKVKVALIGCHSMGYEDLNILLDYPEAECTALRDVNNGWLNKRAADVKREAGKKVPHLYKDWQRVIDGKGVDVVIISTLDHWHCLSTVWTCQAGEDVYVEKPFSNTIEECNLMEEAARKYNRII